MTLGPSRRTLADMTIRQVSSGKRARRRVAWTLLGVAAALGLGAGVVADLVYGGGDHLVAVLASGLCVVGVAAGFVASPSSGNEELGPSNGPSCQGWSAL